MAKVSAAVCYDYVTEAIAVTLLSGRGMDDDKDDKTVDFDCADNGGTLLYWCVSI